MHVGLQDWASEIDMRKLTLAEITLLGTYTYTTADLRATVAALHGGVFGDLCVGRGAARSPTGPQAFIDLDQGRQRGGQDRAEALNRGRRFRCRKAAASQ